MVKIHISSFSEKLFYSFTYVLRFVVYVLCFVMFAADKSFIKRLWWCWWWWDNKVRLFRQYIYLWI